MIRSYRNKYGVSKIQRDSYSNATTNWKEIRQKVLARDGYRCRDCGKSLVGVYKREVHHIKELSKGGRTVTSNLKSLCSSCHKKKHKHLR